MAGGDGLLSIILYFLFVFHVFFVYLQHETDFIIPFGLLQPNFGYG